MSKKGSALRYGRKALDMMTMETSSTLDKTQARLNHMESHLQDSFWKRELRMQSQITIVMRHQRICETIWDDLSNIKKSAMPLQGNSYSHTPRWLSYSTQDGNQEQRRNSRDNHKVDAAVRARTAIFCNSEETCEAQDCRKCVVRRHCLRPKFFPRLKRQAPGNLAVGGKSNVSSRPEGNLPFKVEELLFLSLGALWPWPNSSRFCSIQAFV